ncbi:hypothetical protein GALL_497060 [mine drainage metagenome]|uniref:Uncharacterized protein n=1 Tax=mine drainage metagenome TaxID=410659 RepID=A0A1J5PAP1_9ZZZZ
MPGALRAQPVDHVAEKLDMPALIAGDGDAVGVLLDGGGDDLVHAAVVPKVDDLRPHADEDAPHDVDRRVVAVEQRRCGDEAQPLLRTVGGQNLGVGQVGHCGLLRRGVHRAARIGVHRVNCRS